MKSLLIAIAMTGTFAAPVAAHHHYEACETARCDVAISSSSLTSDQQSLAGQEQEQASQQE